MKSPKGGRPKKLGDVEVSGSTHFGAKNVMLFIERAKRFVIRLCDIYTRVTVVRH